MAETLTFDSLLADLRAYVERGDASDPTVFDQLPRLINSAERDIARALKIQGFIVEDDLTLSSGLNTYLKPAAWLDTVSMHIFGFGAETFVYPRSYEYCVMYDSGENDRPEFYADLDFDNWRFSPTPDLAYVIRHSTYQQPALLDAANQTNWLTDEAPNVLRHGALLKLSQFLGKKEGIAMWKPEYDRDLSLLNGEDLQKIIDRTTTRQEA